MQNKDAAVSERDYTELRQRIRNCWRRLGILQLRITNTVYLGKNRLSIQTIQNQIKETRDELSAILSECEKV